MANLDSWYDWDALICSEFLCHQLRDEKNLKKKDFPITKNKLMGIMVTFSPFLENTQACLTLKTWTTRIKLTTRKLESIIYKDPVSCWIACAQNLSILHDHFRMQWKPSTSRLLSLSSMQQILSNAYHAQRSNSHQIRKYCWYSCALKESILDNFHLGLWLAWVWGSQKWTKECDFNQVWYAKYEWPYQTWSR